MEAPFEAWASGRGNDVPVLLGIKYCLMLPSASGMGQGRGNSLIFVQKLYVCAAFCHAFTMDEGRLYML